MRTKPRVWPGDFRHRFLLLAAATLVGLLIGLVGGYGLAGKGAGRHGVLAALKRLSPVGHSEQSPPGQWSLAAQAPDASLTRAQRARIQELQSLGYAGATHTRPSDSGVIFYDAAKASSQPLFYCSGHAPEALLIDRQGRTLHRWSLDYETVRASNPAAFLPPAPDGATACWRRAQLLPDGDILAIFEGHGLIKLDARSRLLWAYPGACHHDLHVDDDGRIWVLTREATVVPRLDPEDPVLLDYFTVLSPDGVEERRISLLEAFERSDYAPFLENAPAAGDIFHTNTLRRLDGSLASLSPLFRAGNILTSIREMNVIAILDPRQERIVWALSGLWSRQHDPRLLPTGRILLFDNLGAAGRSRVIEFDPFSQEIIWSYADGPEHPLFSRTCGACHRLANGNTLIVESDNGHALEVTPDQRIVWEYYNPQRGGEHDELIAAILDMNSLPASFNLDWLPPEARPES
jgi:hypothetical protein